MHRQFSLILAAMLLTMAFPPVTPRAQDNADEVAIRKLVEQLFDAYQKKDLDGVMARWSPNSPLFADFKQYAQNDFVVSHETQFADITLTRWKLETRRAFVRLRFGSKWRDVKTQQSAQQTAIWDMEFVREGSDWKLWQQVDAATHFARRLNAAKLKKERAELLRQDKELITAEFVTMLNHAALTGASQGKFNEALRLNDNALEVADELGEIASKGQCYFSRGMIFYNQSEYREALGSHERALQFFQATPNKRGEAWALHYIGILHELAARYADALVQEKASLKLMREVGDKAGEVSALVNIGNTYQKIGDAAQGLAHYEASLEIAREIGDKGAEATLLNNIGINYEFTGKLSAALSQYEASLKLTRESSNRGGEASTLGNIGNLHLKIGKPAEALAQYEASLKITREIRDKAGEATTIGSIGNVYERIGQPLAALAQYEAALKLTREIGNRVLEAAVLEVMGNAYYQLSKLSEALVHYEASLKIYSEIGDRSGQASALNNTGNAYRLIGRHAEALAQFEASLKIKREIGAKAGEVSTLGNLGNVYQDIDQFSEALTYYEEGLKISREMGLTFDEAELLMNIAEVYRVQKQWRQAVDTYQKVTPLIELARTRTKEPSLQTSLYAQYSHVYYGLIESLLELGSSRDEVFAVSERAKARTLVDMMTGGKISILKSMTHAERQEEEQLNANFIAASGELNAAYFNSTPDQRRLDELRQQMNNTRDDYAKFRVRLFIAHPELQVQRASYDPLALAQLSEALFAKDPHLCLLSYLVGKDKTFLFVITSGRNSNAPVNLNVYSLKADKSRVLTANELKDRLNEFRLRYTAESGPYKQLARNLHELLLAPAKNELKGRSRVIIIPDGMLYALPFQALIDERDKHFIESHTVSYAPSITALIQMMKLADKRKRINANTQPLLAMGRRTFPDQAQYRNLELPKAEEQVKSIARLFGVTALTGTEATKAKAILEMRTSRYVHFATHGELNEIAPMESAIVLGKSASDDGRLYARELVDMDLQADLVTLSACDTGLGQAVSGEGILGLTWALFVAGTPTSVVTQWKVRDDSMNQVMLEFYRQMRLSGANGRPAITKAEALRHAQLRLMRNDAYKHPYYWAPVVLVGDWR